MHHVHILIYMYIYPSAFKGPQVHILIYNQMPRLASANSTSTFKAMHLGMFTLKVV